MTLGDRVKARRTELRLSQDELAHRMGYASRSYVNKIEKGRPVSQKVIVKLAEALGVSELYLMGYDDPQQSNVERVTGYMRTVRIFDPISCGTGMLIDENAIGYLAIPGSDTSASAEYFANQASGDSMEPKIHNGDYVIFEQSPELESGQIGSFSLNGEYYCKRFRRLQDGSVWLISENSKYDPIPVKPGDDFRVLGKYKMRLTRD